MYQELTSVDSGFLFHLPLDFFESAVHRRRVPDAAHMRAVRQIVGDLIP
jgi:hypothetical protein